MLTIIDKKTIARWESGGGRDWLEVYEVAQCGVPIGYSYSSRNGGGWLGAVPRELALSRFQHEVEQGLHCSQKSQMRKVL